MAEDRYQIRVERFNSNWKEETVVLPFGGAIREQMKNLARGLRDRQGDRAIRIYVYDTETGKEYDEHRYYGNI